MDKNQIDALIKHLNFHSLRKEVIFEDMTQYISIFSYIYLGNEIYGKEDSSNSNKQIIKPCETEGKVWEAMQSNIEYFDSEECEDFLVTENLAFFDPRTVFLGARFYCHPEEIKENEVLTRINTNKQFKMYKILRYLYGIGEGEEVVDYFPLNCNFHYLGGINFKKGCYLGQELTQRTYHTGVIRKRILPFIITNELNFVSLSETENVDIPINSIDTTYTFDLKGVDIIDSTGEKVGKVIANENNCGIAMINTDTLKVESAKYTIEGDQTIILDYKNYWKREHIK